MKLFNTDYLGIGIGFNFIKNELSIHFFIWCLDISFKNYYNETFGQKEK